MAPVFLEPFSRSGVMRVFPTICRQAVPVSPFRKLLRLSASRRIHAHFRKSQPVVEQDLIPHACEERFQPYVLLAIFVFQGARASRGAPTLLIELPNQVIQYEATGV